MLEFLGTAVLGSDSSDELYAVYLMFLPMVAIHELGHVVADLAVGFRVVTVKIGPIVVYGQRSLGKSIDALGFVICEIDRIRRIRSRYFAAVVGGPLANLIVAGLLTILRSQTSSFASTLCHQGASVALLLAALSLVPYHASGVSSDGYKLRLLLRGGPRYVEWLATRAIVNELLKGKKIEQIKNTWLKRATSSGQLAPTAFTATVVLYAREYEMKNIERAAELLEHILTLASRGSDRKRDLWALEAASFQAWHRRDRVKADTWRRRVENFDALSPIQKARFEVAYHSCEGNFAKAMENWEVGRKYLEGTGSTPLNETRLQSWLKWRSQLEERANQATPITNV